MHLVVFHTHTHSKLSLFLPLKSESWQHINETHIFDFTLKDESFSTMLNRKYSIICLDFNFIDCCEQSNDKITNNTRQTYFCVSFLLVKPWFGRGGGGSLILDYFLSLVNISPVLFFIYIYRISSRCIDVHIKFHVNDFAFNQQVITNFM